MSPKNSNLIQLGHGSGGRLTGQIIREIIAPSFNNKILNEYGDSAIFTAGESELAFTCDSYVVDPIFFPGGDIGKLAVCGTVNDIAVAGAKPLYLSAGFIIEEGFPIESLELIVKSMAEAARISEVQIVTGDTKVVPKGKGDGIYINTSGVGLFGNNPYSPLRGVGIGKGDKIIINGTIGDHAIAVLGARGGLNFSTYVESDCAPLNTLISGARSCSDKIKFARDVTRGGLATLLVDMAESTGYELKLYEKQIPVKPDVESVCELLGFDPLYLANEGKVVIVVSEEDAAVVLEFMRSHPMGKDSSVIGQVVNGQSGRVSMETTIGGSREISMLYSDMLPRIC